MIVAVVVLYYFVIYMTYLLAYYSSLLVSVLPENLNLGDQNITIGDLLCQFSDDLCIESLQQFTQTLPVPNKIIAVLPWIRTSVEWVFAGPLIVTPLICLLQMWLLSKDIKTHLKQMYKGKCEFVLKASSLSNASIASGSFHFGG